MASKRAKAKAYIYGVKERRRLLAVKRSNAVIAEAMLMEDTFPEEPEESARKQSITFITISLRSSFPLFFCISILLLYTALSFLHAYVAVYNTHI
jgi:hypothetical protein